MGSHGTLDRYVESHYFRNTDIHPFSSVLSTLTDSSFPHFQIEAFPGPTRRRQKLNLGLATCKTVALVLNYGPASVHMFISRCEFLIQPRTQTASLCGGVHLWNKLPFREYCLLLLIFLLISFCGFLLIPFERHCHNAQILCKQQSDIIAVS